MTIMEIQEPAEKQRIARAILEALPDWFGIEESREGYIKDSAELPRLTGKSRSDSSA